ncbi:hypothetical protein CEE37_07525 [candidate division LCP-89 bacterium B3_LCP]|uniref:Secretion system C-terminal sorting domain-containing protein n=1 Tax=candidate division LCP-89 bacterium B3_LCP TaxID=2012998 RepID=A0A532V0R8_UNCL8|nr:MAG: hypothetical protein CEE37_07525 [candidate division LCP-89 bacterium B3_LCP]
MKQIILTIFLLIASLPALAQVQQLEAWWIDTGETDSTGLGTACAPLGDINGDGLNDFLVGTWNEEAFVYFGSEEPDTIPRLRIPSPSDSVFWFGMNLFNIGDINADEGEDFAVGAWISDVPIDHQIVYVYFGGGVLDSIPDLVLDGGENDYSYFGSSGISVGDFNGDGGNDFLILDSEYLINQSPELIKGRLSVFYGGDILDSIPDWEISASEYFTRIGGDAALLGDINEDGYDDFVMVDSYCQGPQAQEKAGIMAIYYGGVQPDTLANLIVYGDHEYAWLGKSVDAIDFDSNGQKDIVVGGSNNLSSEYLSAVYVYLVSENMDDQPDFIFPDSGNPGLGTGNGIFGMDINGDGWQDIVSANSWNIFMAGQIYVYLGGADPDTLLDAEYYQSNIDAGLGSGACNAGDINNDSIDDLIVGEQGYNQFYTGNLWGRIHVILGDTSYHQSVGIFPQQYPSVPSSLLFLRAYPNPFNAEVTFEIESLRSGYKTLKIYNLRGEIVREFKLANGVSKVTWDGKADTGISYSSGIYIVRVSDSKEKTTKKVVLLK